MAEKSYQVVLAGIEADLLAGRLEVGGKLPGERLLAERYGVSRASVREAVRTLESLGMVRTATGSGPDAGAIVTAEPAAPIAATFRWHLASRHLPVADIVQARVLIESWAVRAAAGRQRPTAAPPVDSQPIDDALSEAADLLAAMDEPGLTAPEFLALDARYHVALARSADNAVVAAIMSAMRMGIEQYVTAALERIADWDAMAARLRREHRGIYTAIRAGDGDLASGRVQRHIEGFYRATGLAAPGPGTEPTEG